MCLEGYNYTIMSAVRLLPFDATCEPFSLADGWAAIGTDRTTDKACCSRVARRQLVGLAIGENKSNYTSN